MNELIEEIYLYMLSTEQKFLVKHLYVCFDCKQEHIRLDENPFDDIGRSIGLQKYLLKRQGNSNGKRKEENISNNG